MKPTLRRVLARLAANPAELAKHAPQLCRATATGTLAALRSGGEELTPARRQELLAELRAGAIVELEADLHSFEQRAGEDNRNFILFRDGMLMGFGRTGRGNPLLRDHNQDDSLSKGGVIEASATIKVADGHYVIKQTATLKAPWLVEMALLGLLDSLSIGWWPTGPVLCSACNAPVFSKCYHWPGDRLAEVDAEGGGKRKVRQADGPIVVRWVFTEAELVETSVVNVGAVPSARIENIRASFAASLAAGNPDLRAELASGGDFLHGDLVPEETQEMDPELLKLLGLPATASPAEVLAAAQRLRTDAAELTIVKGQLTRFETQIAELQAGQRKRDEDTFITDALGTGRIGKGDEEHWRTLYQLDSKRALELMGKREAGSATPVGQPPQRGGEPRITGGTRVRMTAAELAAKSPQWASAFGYVGEGIVPTTLSATTIQNNADLDSARTGFHAAFLQQLELKTDDPISMIYTEVPSTKKLETHHWMGDLPMFEEWTGDRKLAGLEAFKLTIENKKWANGIRVKNDDIKDDALGLLPPQVQGLAGKAKRHRFDLMVKFLLNGFDGTAYPETGTGLAYDGAFFFADSHRGGNDNKLTSALDAAALSAAEQLLSQMTTYDGNDPLELYGTHLIVGPKLRTTAEKLLQQDRLANGEDNINKGKYKLIVSNRIRGTYDDYWFLADLSSPIKPLLFQMREEISTSAIIGQSNNDSVPSFINDELWFGAQARYNVAHFEFRTIVGSAVA